MSCWFFLVSGRIQDNKMIWQPLYQHPPTLLKALGEDRICMDLEGVRHEGMVVYSASSSKLLINWSDGEEVKKLLRQLLPALEARDVVTEVFVQKTAWEGSDACFEVLCKFLCDKNRTEPN
eukprot:s1324_g32.t1